MASTFTPNKGYEKQATGENPGTWGELLNDNVTGTIDTNLGGVASKTLSSSNVTLTSAEAQCPLLRLNGVLTDDVMVTTSAQGLLLVENLTTGNFDVSLYNGFGVPVTGPQGRRYILFSDPVNTEGIRGIASLSSSELISIPVGTLMLFMQLAVPTGWSLSGALNEYGLVINAVGGVTAGSVSWPSIFGQTATGSTAITTSTMPSHNHTLELKAATSNPSGNYAHFNGRTSVTATNVAMNYANTGGGGSHSHPIDLQLKRVTTIAGTRTT